MCVKQADSACCVLGVRCWFYVNNLSVRVQAKVRKKTRKWWKFYSESSLFIEAGGSFRNSPRFDRCEVSGGRVSTPTFRGYHFLLKFRDFRGIGLLESTHFPEGLVLGNSRKTCHPRNVEFDKIREMSFQDDQPCEDLESWTCEAPKSWACEDLESWSCEALEVANLWSSGILNLRSPKVANLWSSGILNSRSPWSREPLKIWNLKSAKPWSRNLVKTRSHEPVKLWIRESTKFGNLLKLKFGGCGAWRFPE
jgi:hypothetical protein